MIKYDVAKFALLALLLVYLFMGLFPSALYETDALGIITGCKRMIEEGKFGENYYTYNFQSQPGIFFWVLSVNKLFKINLIDAYSIVSAWFGFLFFALSACFLCRLLHVSFILCAVCLLLFQEIYSAWFYMNSATGAAFFMLIAFLVILKSDSLIRLAIGGVFLPLSAWTRLDIVIAFPTILFLLKSESIKKLIGLSSFVFIVFFIFISLLIYVSNAHNAVNDAIQGGGSFSFLDNQQTASSFFSSQFVRSLVGYFSLLVLILIGYGTYLMILCKDWRLVSVYFFPLLLFVLLVGGRIVAGKHLLYYTPFFALPVVYVFKHIADAGYRQNKFLLFVLLAVFILQYIVGFQFLLTSYPYGDKDYASIKPYPTVTNLFSLRSPFRQVDSLKIVIGCGTKLATSDEMMLSSGILFSPIMWQQLKLDSKTDYDAIGTYLSTFNEDTLHITTSQGGIYPVKNILYLCGYTVANPESDLYVWGLDYQYIWKKKNKIVIVDQATYSKESYEQYVAKLTSFHYKKYLHIAFWDWERWYLNRYGNYSDKLNNVGYLIVNK